MSTTLGSFVAGGIAACGAVTVTHSFETIKIRLQLQGELQAKTDAPKMYRGVFHGMRVVFQNEGMKGLLRGLNCAVSCTKALEAALRGLFGDAVVMLGISTRAGSLELSRGEANLEPSLTIVHLPNDPQWLPIRLLRTASNPRQQRRHEAQHNQQQ